MDKLDCLDQKIDDVTTNTGERIDSVNDAVDALEEKPGKQWDSLKDKILWFIVEVVLIIAALKIGLK